MVLKMRIVNSIYFEQALAGCVRAFGCMIERKRTLVHIIVFYEEDIAVIRDALEDAGSRYVGRYEL